jgi:SAM-dependent methyltransferase
MTERISSQAALGAANRSLLRLRLSPVAVALPFLALPLCSPFVLLSVPPRQSQAHLLARHQAERRRAGDRLRPGRGYRAPGGHDRGGTHRRRRPVGRADPPGHRAQRRGHRARLRRGSADALPFADNSFDKAFAINSMQVWPDAMAGLREIRRAQPKAGLAERLIAAGFINLRIEETGNFCVLASKP